MTKTPAISVVMPVYNTAGYLPQAIESILDQTFGDFELIIIDDGSSDATPDIVKQYAGRDPRIVAVRQDNQGIVKALNRGCRMARGKYIARMDADDISFAERFEKQVDFLERNAGIGIVGTWFRHLHDKDIRAESRPPSSFGAIRWDLNFYNCICHPSVMMRRETMQPLGFYRNDYPHCEDYDLWIRASRVTRIANIPDVLLHYRISDQSVSKTHTALQLESHVRLMKEAMSLFFEDLPASELTVLRYAQTGWVFPEKLPIHAAEKRLTALRDRFARLPGITAQEAQYIRKSAGHMLNSIYIRSLKRRPWIALDPWRTIPFLMSCDYKKPFRWGSRYLKIGIRILRETGRKADKYLLAGLVYKSFYLPLKKFWRPSA